MVVRNCCFRTAAPQARAGVAQLRRHNEGRTRPWYESVPPRVHVTFRGLVDVTCVMGRDTGARLVVGSPHPRRPRRCCVTTAANDSSRRQQRTIAAKLGNKQATCASSRCRLPPPPPRTRTHEHTHGFEHGVHFLRRYVTVAVFVQLFECRHLAGEPRLDLLAHLLVARVCIAGLCMRAGGFTRRPT
jgi:hypothetical protein